MMKLGCFCAKLVLYGEFDEIFYLALRRKRTCPTSIYVNPSWGSICKVATEGVADILVGRCTTPNYAAVITPMHDLSDRPTFHSEVKDLEYGRRT
jgi:hypothetical protein